MSLSSHDDGMDVASRDQHRQLECTSFLHCSTNSALINAVEKHVN